jgi:UDP-MurNAc hydroxylase
MKLEFITNASFLIHFNDGRTLLTDPWYTDGIYLGTLFNFPPLTNEDRQRYLNARPDFIYISHYHGDHLDPASLRHYPRGTPVLIGAFPTPTLRNAINGCGFSDIRELAFGEPSEFNGLRIVIFRQFAASTDDNDSDDAFPIDTSIFLRESNESSLFFCVDNPMQIGDATQVRERFGPIDVALLPYSGASIYPWVFKNYSHEEKLERMSALRLSRLEKFCQLADEISAKHVVPAAGSFVYGGKLASQARYQLQATPPEIQDYLRSRPIRGFLHLMSTGDVLDCDNGKLECSKDARFRQFADEDRIAYAQTLAHFRCPIDDLTWPSDLQIPWKHLVRRARVNMWLRQEELGLFPSSDVELVVTGGKHLEFGPKDLQVRIPLDRNTVETGQTEPSRSFVRFYLSWELLLSILLGAVFWNVAEYLMSIERDPDRFEVNIHRLMAYMRI